MPDKTRRQKELIKPRSRVDQALRKLETCLATDAGPIREQLRAFAKGFRDYSPLNRILIGLQRPDATFLKGRKQ